MNTYLWIHGIGMVVIVFLSLKYEKKPPQPAALFFWPAVPITLLILTLYCLIFRKEI